MDHDNQNFQGPGSPPHEAERPAEQPSKKPSYTANHAKQGKDGKSYFNRVGAAFPHKDGKGHNIELDSVPVNGRIVLREYVQKLKDGERPAQPENTQEHDR